MNLDEITNENKLLKLRVIELEERLKKYTNPARNRQYYENNKEEIKARNHKPYVSSSEQRKEYNKRAYEKRKEKIKSLSDA